MDGETRSVFVYSITMLKLEYMYDVLTCVRR